MVALDRGAAREVVEDGVTGLVAQDVDDMVRAIPHVRSLDPRRCAQRARERFSADRMAQEYLRIYEAVCAAA